MVSKKYVPVIKCNRCNKKHERIYTFPLYRARIGVFKQFYQPLRVEMVSLCVECREGFIKWWREGK